MVGMIYNLYHVDDIDIGFSFSLQLYVDFQWLLATGHDGDSENYAMFSSTGSRIGNPPRQSHYLKQTRIAVYLMCEFDMSDQLTSCQSHSDSSTNSY